MNSVKLAPLLLVFVEVAREGSFTAAAKNLSMSKSAISQQIKRLEEAVGAQLLVRNTRGLVLTLTGETLLSRSELLNEQLSLTLSELNQLKAQPSGRFKISVPPFFEKNIVIPAVKQLCLEFPKLQPEVVVTGRWQDLIQYGLDGAIFGGDLKDCAYKALSVGKVAEIICASPRYLQQNGGIESVEQLPSHAFIATPWQHTRLQLYNNKSKQTQFVSLEHRAKTTSMIAALEMAIADMGVVLYPEFLAQEAMLSNQLRRIIPDVQGRTWHFYFLHQFQNNKPIHVSRFYQLICYYFNKESSN